MRRVCPCFPMRTCAEAHAIGAGVHATGAEAHATGAEAHATGAEAQADHAWGFMARAEARRSVKTDKFACANPFVVYIEC